MEGPVQEFQSVHDRECAVDPGNGFQSSLKPIHRREDLLIAHRPRAGGLDDDRKRGDAGEPLVKLSRGPDHGRFLAEITEIIGPDLEVYDPRKRASRRANGDAVNPAAAQRNQHGDSRQRCVQRAGPVWLR